MSSRRVHVKNLASWVGLLQSVRLAVGPLISLMCRSIYDDISNARSWKLFCNFPTNVSIRLTGGLGICLPSMDITFAKKAPPLHLSLP